MGQKKKKSRTYEGVPSLQKLLWNSEGMQPFRILWKENWMYQITPEGPESLGLEYCEKGSEKKDVKKEHDMVRQSLQWISQAAFF